MALRNNVFKERTLKCAACSTAVKLLLWDTDAVPPCAACGGLLERDYAYASAAAAVIDDSIPGGLLIRHGLCWPDGTPRRFDSRTEIRRAEKEAGLTNHVEHKPTPGSDKSPHTTRWV